MMLVSAVVIVLLVCFGWFALRRRRARLPRWKVVADGTGKFTFYNGEGYLYPIDFQSFEEAAVKMSEVMSSPPVDLVAESRIWEARERRYQSNL